jgi:hypothetical protein
MTREEMLQSALDLERTNDEIARDVDALLAAACSRFLNAGALINHMRVLRSKGSMDEYWRAALKLADHLHIAGHSLTTAHEKLLGPAARQIGGLIN